MPRPEIDVDLARSQTPGCRSVIHLNNAGAALPPAVVTDRVVGHLRREASIGGYEAATEAGAAIEGIYASVARLLGCAPGEIALTESATRAWNTAVSGLRLESGDVVVTGLAEYSSNVLAFLQLARLRGVEVEVLGDDEAGELDLAGLRSALERLGSRARLVALTHVPTSSGLVNPAAAAGRIARDAGVPFLLDACQSVGQIDLDVGELGCDLLSATGRKFLRAPRGTGFLYVSEAIRDRLEPPVVDLYSASWVAEDRYRLRPDARRFETFEADVAARLGLGAAVDHALGWGLAAIEARVTALAERLRLRLADLRGVAVHDRGRRRCGIVTFSVAGQAAAAVRDRLRASAVNTSVVSAAGARLDLGRRGLGDLVRASVHYYNTEEELDRLLGLLAELTGVSPPGTGQGRGMSEPRVHDDQPADPVAEPETSGGTASAGSTGSGADRSADEVPTGGNAAQAAAVFGVHSEPPVEMDSGGAG